MDEQPEAAETPSVITVFLADDNLLVREGVRALLNREADLEVVGVAGDYDGLVEGAIAAAPQVVVTDIRMPPTFQREGIEAAKEVRRRLPGIGIVVLSQYDDPEYAIALLEEGAAGYAYQLKDRIAEGDQLVAAVRAVATGGTALDPVIVDKLTRPLTSRTGLPAGDEELLRFVAEGKPMKAIAVARRTTAEAVSDDIERLFLDIAQQASVGGEGALRRLRLLHQAIVDREEQGRSLSRLLPGGIAEKVRLENRPIGETEDVVISVLMSDIRGYSGIAERTTPSALAAQLNEHRAAMNGAILGEGGTVMQFVGDAVMAVFGAPIPQEDHAAHSLVAARAMHAAQHLLNVRWTRERREPFGLGIGISTGEAAAALLGSEERLEYTVVGDTVNLSQRLQQWAEHGEIVLSEPTWSGLGHQPDGAEHLPAELVKGRAAPVSAWKLKRVEVAG
ncbi:hypothetical protein BH10ACT1_BH10ACT1_16630 [soil metagenome]